MSRYYRLLLDDYSAASFTSFDKDYFGTLEEINEFFESMKADKELAERQKYVLSVYDQYLAGNKTISHNVAYREVPFLVPAKVLGMAKSELTDYSWEHLNTWRWTYEMRCGIVVSDHIWFSCYGRYTRCVKANFTNLQYTVPFGKYKPLGDVFWGYPCQITGKNGTLRNRLYVVEKWFKNKTEAMDDQEKFKQSPDPDFSRVLDDIFGDG